MKPILRSALLILSAILLITACKKDDNNEPSSGDMLIGKWKAIEYWNKEVEGADSVEHADSLSVSGDYLEFRKDLSYEALSAKAGGRKNTGTYKLVGASKLLMDNSTEYSIIKLTSTDLVLYYSSTYDAGPAGMARAEYRYSYHK